MDVRDPSEPQGAAIIHTSGGPVTDVLAHGETVFMAVGNAASWPPEAQTGRGIRVVDVADPERPRLVASVPTQGWPTALQVRGSRVFVADSTWGVLVFDISNPWWPHQIGRGGAAGYPADLAVEGEAPLCRAEFGTCHSSPNELPSDS